MVIKIENLVKRYGDLTAVDNLSLEVEEGEIFGLLGPNGSGKTTTLNCILSLLKYEKGNIEIFDRPMSPTAYDIKRDIGVVSQNVAVYNELTVYENVDYFCGLYIYDKGECERLVEEALVLTGLVEFKKFYPKKLSGGLLRRLNIACGIAHKPKLIIFDEPTVAVDPQSRNNILEGILKLNKEGATIIYTSHYMEEIEQLCNRIVIMDKGKIIATGSKEELKEMIGVKEKITIEVTNMDEESVRELANLDNVADVEYKHNVLTIKSLDGKHSLTNILYFLQEKNASIGSVYSERPTLNDVFLEITGKELRDYV